MTMSRFKHSNKEDMSREIVSRRTLPTHTLFNKENFKLSEPMPTRQSRRPTPPVMLSKLKSMPMLTSSMKKLMEILFLPKHQMKLKVPQRLS